MTPAFSIIIPLYNKEHYIKSTLESVLNQSFSDFEIIIVNDGSTDKSEEKAQAVLQNFKNFTLVNQKNSGLSATRNKGISLAKGTIIALLDADDIWHKDFLQSIWQLYLNFPEASFYGTDYYEKYDDNTLITPKKNINPSLKNTEFVIDDFFKANLFQLILCQSSIAFKRNLEDITLFDESINYSEDIDFYIRNFTKHHLAYKYTPLSTILCDVPDQITKIGIKNKTLPDLDQLERQYGNNDSLKKYLDFYRYMYAIESKLDKDYEKFSTFTKHLNINNLSRKQKILLKCPIALLKVIRSIKQLLLKYNFRVTTFSN
ncbi:MAG: glycosyltransferase family 2 protein [Jejuia sp.]